MQDKRVLITGGTGALGAAVTREAVARGARATVAYIDEAEKRALAGSLGSSVVWEKADLSDEDAVERLVDGMESLHVLIHLVGGFEMGPTHEISLAAWRKHLDLNLTTTFLCCKHALGRMREGGYGRIVTVGSKAVLDPMGQAAAYSASKAGVVALTRVIAAETKGTGITANAVLPSIIDTPANRAAMGADRAADWVSPAALAAIIAHLASEQGGALRGAAVPVYGDV
jgi:NAD(P)-dependent dehydrogenase (short-subunit alcohol dehydrogenase family)